MEHVTTQEIAKEQILKFEKQFPVDKWSIGDIHIWPYVRIKLYFALLSDSSKLTGPTNRNVTKKVWWKSFKKITFFFDVLKSLISLKLFFLKLQRKQILFFGSHFHRILQDNKYFNRFYDAMVDFHKLQDEVYMVEYQRVYKNTYNRKAVIPLNKHLNEYKLLNKIFNRNIRNPEVKLKEYNKFCELLNGIKIEPESISILEKDLIKWSIKMKSLEKFFLKLYNKANPSKVLFLGYYGYDDLYAALLVANSLKIKTIDFQHGPQTNVHMAYANWTKVPKSGFNTMPKEFWNWDKKSKENIEEWASKVDNVKAMVYGQPYISYWLQRNKSLNEPREYILYSMQTSPLELFTPQLIRLIIQSKHKWVLRLHPRNNTSVLEIEKFLKENKIIDKTNIQDPILNPLPKVISQSVLHITNYSGCTIECNMMGVPTVLIHKIGHEMFDMYLDNKYVYFLDQENRNFEQNFLKLLSKIEKDENVNNQAEMLNPIHL